VKTKINIFGYDQRQNVAHGLRGYSLIDGERKKHETSCGYIRSPETGKLKAVFASAIELL